MLDYVRFGEDSNFVICVMVNRLFKLIIIINNNINKIIVKNFMLINKFIMNKFGDKRQGWFDFMGEMRLCFFFNSVFVEYVEQKFLFLRVGLGLDNLVLFLEIRVGLFVFFYLY